MEVVSDSNYYDSFEDAAAAMVVALDRNSLLEVMKNMDPQTILDLCSTNSTTNAKCADPLLMRDLIQHFYPGEDPTADPAKRFRELSTATINKWYFYVDKSTDEVAWSTTDLTNDVDLNMVDRYMIEIRKGIVLSTSDFEEQLPISSKIEALLPRTRIFVEVFVAVHDQGDTQAFRTMEDARQYINQQPDANKIYKVKLTNTPFCIMPRSSQVVGPPRIITVHKGDGKITPNARRFAQTAGFTSRDDAEIIAWYKNKVADGTYKKGLHGICKPVQTPAQYRL